MGRSRWQPPNVLFRPADVSVAPDVLRRAMSRGDVVRLAHGVYLAAQLLPTDPGTRHVVQACAVQMARPDLVASHGTAALALGLPLLHPAVVAGGAPSFTRPPKPGRRGERRPRVVVRELPTSAVTSHDNALGGLPVTTAARTALDLACELPLAEALMITDHVARTTASGYVVSRDLRGKLSERARSVALRPLQEAQVAPIHRRRRAMRALELTDPRRESAAESLSFGRIVQAGLPIPDCQHPVTLAAGQMYVDFWWEEYGLAGECDGRVKYDGTFGPDDAALVREADRHHALLESGIDVIRWRAVDMMFRPEIVLARLAARLRARGWQG